ncbi:MAG: phosphoglucomutase, alpha-D-glucose phosphate-specific, partial [Gemmatimonadota bacterium]|nr:phosphoglucomutase, alpha-D-glucose phosphate-specific [Gemmatimonadota bacterium]
MSVHPLAGKPAPHDARIDLPALLSRYHSDRPQPEEPGERVSFGTSGHRGSSLHRSFNEDHIASICQAIAEHRRAEGITGPLFLGRDTHGLSEPALDTALEVLGGNGVRLVLSDGSPYAPTPVISHAILGANRGAPDGLADGVVITPSHNPPEDGGFKYNPPTGGPADTAITSAIEARANALLAEGLRGVERIPRREAEAASTLSRRDLRGEYIADLGSVLDMEAIGGSGLRIGVDPMGGASVHYWE